MFTQEQVDSFNKQGCLLVPKFLTPEHAKDLLLRSHELLKDFDVKTHPMSVFTTSDKAHVGDEYFLNSSDNVSFFFEPSALEEKHGKTYLVKPKEQAINKFGHALHLYDSEFEKVTVKNPKVEEIVKKLGFHLPRALQSMVICKQPGIGGAVPSHQDGVFLYTNPQSAVGFWIALEDATIENGCLSYAPGSHSTHPITKRFVRRFDKTTGEELGGTEFIYLNGHEETIARLPPDEKLKWVTVECKAGDLVLIHNSVLHRSETNRSEKSRFAYAFHVIEGTAEYDKLNWLQSKVFSAI